jgi:hypothetical protein
MNNIECFQNQNYGLIKSEYFRTGIPFEDSLFPPHTSSIYKGAKPVKSFLKDKQGNEKRVEWKRPGEIVDHPKFIINEFSRKDLHQGSIGLVK